MGIPRSVKVEVGDMEKNRIDAITEKERQCIAMTSLANIPENPRIVKELVDPFSDVLHEPLWLLPIFIPLAIVLAPFQVVDAIRTYKRKRKEHNENWSKYNEFDGHHGDKHILSLWDEYGFGSRVVYKADINRKKIAACISDWLGILYPSKYYLSSEEILAQFPQAAAQTLQLGVVDEAEKGWLLKNATVLLYPSISEGFGLNPFEAAQVGTPALTSRGGSLAEVLGDDVVYFESFDPEESADILWTLIKDESARARQTAQTRK